MLIIPRVRTGRATARRGRNARASAFPTGRLSQTVADDDAPPTRPPRIIQLLSVYVYTHTLAFIYIYDTYGVYTASCIGANECRTMRDTLRTFPPKLAKNKKNDRATRTRELRFYVSPRRSRNEYMQSEDIPKLHSVSFVLVAIATDERW